MAQLSIEDRIKYDHILKQLLERDNIRSPTYLRAQLYNLTNYKMNRSTIRNKVKAFDNEIDYLKLQERKPYERQTRLEIESEKKVSKYYSKHPDEHPDKPIYKNNKLVNEFIDLPECGCKYVHKLPRFNKNQTITCMKCSQTFDRKTWKWLSKINKDAWME